MAHDGRRTKERPVNDKATKVVLVDDQTLYRESLRMLMEHWDEFSVVGDASNGNP